MEENAKPSIIRKQVFVKTYQLLTYLFLIRRYSLINQQATNSVESAIGISHTVKKPSIIIPILKAR